MPLHEPLEPPASDDGPKFITRTLSEHAAFFLRNLTPRTLFANGLALLWFACAFRMVRWLRRVSANQGHKPVDDKRSAEAASDKKVR